MNDKTSDDRAQRAIPAMTGAVNLLNKMLGSGDIKTSHKARLRTVLAEITATQQRASEPAAAQEAVTIDADVFHAMNGELCDFAIRWQLDGDYLRCTGCKRPQLTNYAGEAFVHAGGCKQAATSEVHPWLALRRIMRPMFAPVAAAPVDMDAHGLRALDSCIADLRRLLELAPDYDLDVMQMQSLETAIESMELRKVMSTPAAPGIDLAALRDIASDLSQSAKVDDYEPQQIAFIESIRDRLVSLTDDASPKGGSSPAPRFELTNGQIAQLHDFAGTPVAGVPLEDQDVLVIQHADAGHSGPGLYAHYDELPEEGAIHLDGQIPASPKGGSDEDTCSLPALATNKMLEAGWPRGEIIDDTFDRQGAYADLLAAALQATSAEVGS